MPAPRQKETTYFPRRLEEDTSALGAEERLMAAAERLTESSAHPIRPLRSDQLPVFRAFSDYLLDVVTHPQQDVCRYCRIVLPPRTGKTVIATHIIDRTELISTFVVPTRVLVHQVADELQQQMPDVPIGLFFGDEKSAVDGGVNVTTYHSLLRHQAKGTLPGSIRRSGLVFVDEAHHSMTELRTNALEQSFDSAAIRVALTATPDYNDRRRLAVFFPRLVHEIDLAEAQRLDLVAPARMWVMEVDVDGSSVTFVAGDYDIEMLGRIMASAPFFRAVELFRYSNPNMPCLIACSSRQQAYDLHSYLVRHRPKGRPSPELVLAETPPENRKRILRDFDAGKVDTLIQVAVLVEGWNAPHCKLLLDLAPTTSRVRAAQKYFRVMTKHQGMEARIAVFLPRDLKRAPVLPSDLLIPPGETYRCGDLLGQDSGGGHVATVERSPISPVKAVVLKKRILVCASLERPRLDPSDTEGIRAVLKSCKEFKPRSNLPQFQRLFFHHPLFSGSGTSLLRWLHIPKRRQEYQSLLCRTFPDTMLHLCDDEIGIAANEPQSPMEFASCLPLDPLGERGRGLDVLARSVGCPGRDMDPERLLLERERNTFLLTAVESLGDRERKAITLRFGLNGNAEMTLRGIGQMMGVSPERVRQLISRGFRRLRHPSRSRGFSDRK